MLLYLHCVWKNLSFQEEILIICFSGAGMKFMNPHNLHNLFFCYFNFPEFAGVKYVRYVIVFELHSLHSEIHNLIMLIWNKEELPHQLKRVNCFTYSQKG
jgi:hypothetical protein